MYLELQGDRWGKQELARVLGLIANCEDEGFLRFLGLMRSIKDGIETTIMQELTLLEGELSYFTSLSS